MIPINYGNRRSGRTYRMVYEAIQRVFVLKDTPIAFILGKSYQTTQLIGEIRKILEARDIPFKFLPSQKKFTSPDLTRRIIVRSIESPEVRGSFDSGYTVYGYPRTSIVYLDHHVLEKD